MTKINPITDSLNTYAKHMIDSIVKDKPAKRTYIRDFLRTANENDAQGTAIVSYFTAYNNAKTNIHNLPFHESERLRNIKEILPEEINAVPELKKQEQKFLSAIEQKYPNSLNKRIDIAGAGAVVADAVKPKSRFAKFVAFLNQFMHVEE